MSTRAAIGWRAHSGWAALVAVAGSRQSLEVVDRRRVELGDPHTAGPKQPYHEAEGQPLGKARRIVDGYAQDARRRAAESLRQTVKDLRSRGYEAVGAALLLASNKPLPALASILASHALIHTADGELFRDALAHAAAKIGLPLRRVRERELSAEASATLHRSPLELESLVAQAGRALGPPWTQDQKLAALAAWLVLVGGAG